MHASKNLPEPWVIAEMERVRRIRESHEAERPSVPLVPPMEPPPRREPSRGSSVIVIDLA